MRIKQGSTVTFIKPTGEWSRGIVTTIDLQNEIAIVKDESGYLWQGPIHHLFPDQ